jgi:hypothetical protein
MLGVRVPVGPVKGALRGRGRRERCGSRTVSSMPWTRGRLLDEHRFRSLGKLVVGNLDRIANVDNIGN